MAFREEVADCAAVGEWERDLCMEREAELQQRFDSVLEDLQQKNESFRIGAEEIVEAAAASCMLRIAEWVDPQHFEPGLAARLRQHKHEVIDRFDREVAECSARADWESMLCKQKSGELQRHLNVAADGLLQRNELLGQLQWRGRLLSLVFIVAVVLSIAFGTMLANSNAGLAMIQRPLASLESLQIAHRDETDDANQEVLSSFSESSTDTKLSILDPERADQLAASRTVPEASDLWATDSTAAERAAAQANPGHDISILNVANADYHVANRTVPDASDLLTTGSTNAEAASVQANASHGTSWRPWRRAWTRWPYGARWRMSSPLLAQDASTPLLFALVGMSLCGIRAELGGMR